MRSCTRRSRHVEQAGGRAEHSSLPFLKRACFGGQLSRPALCPATTAHAQDAPADDEGELDTDDEKDEVAQYESWRERELLRIARDRCGVPQPLLPPPLPRTCSLEGAVEQAAAWALPCGAPRAMV